MRSRSLRLAGTDLRLHHAVRFNHGEGTWPHAPYEVSAESCAILGLSKQQQLDGTGQAR